MRFPVLVLVALSFLLVACVEDPADIDAEKTIEDLILHGAACGDGVLNEWELCEKHLPQPCAEFDPVLYVSGTALCNDTCLGHDLTGCRTYAQCKKDNCGDNGVCELLDTGDFKCVCYEGYIGLNCLQCDVGYYKQGYECIKETL